MTQQYLAGELSVLLARLETVTTSQTAVRDVAQLRRGAETGPVTALPSMVVRALVLTDRLCWDSLEQGTPWHSPARPRSAPSCVTSVSALACSKSASRTLSDRRLTDRV